MNILLMRIFSAELNNLPLAPVVIKSLLFEGLSNSPSLCNVRITPSVQLSGYMPVDKRALKLVLHTFQRALYTCLITLKCITLYTLCPRLALVLKTIFINVLYHILVASLTLMLVISVRLATSILIHIDVKLFQGLEPVYL